MSLSQDEKHAVATLLTVDIVKHYVANNSLPASELPKLLGSVHAAIIGLDQPAPAAPAEPETLAKSPAEIRKSITPDAIISFIDGKPYKTLKRHLGVHGLGPHAYRQRFGLPNDYPIVAPNYAAQRSALAKSIGLGVPGGRAPQQQAA